MLRLCEWNLKARSPTREPANFSTVALMTTHDADNEYVLIDSTIVGADQHSTRAKKGGTDQCQAIRRSRGGLTTKTLRNWISKSNRMHKVGGPAALIGVQAGDVLLSTNGVPVKNIQPVRATVAKSQKRWRL